MRVSRRKFIGSMGLGLAGVGLAAEELVRADGGRQEGSEKLLVANPDQPRPAPKGYDRLDLSWYKGTVRRLKETVKGLGADAILLESDTNKVYFSGCYRGSGERSTWLFFPVGEDDTAYWYGPGIDRDLITSWWCTEFEYYFCYPHAEGGFPNRGQVVRGKRVDLFEWMLEGLKKRGYDGKTIATDMSFYPGQMETIKKVLPRAKFVNISGECLKMRMIKTEEELALTQRAYRYFDKVHAFSRDYILERGTEATDFEIGQALQAYGINLMMKDVERDGKCHSAVGMEVTSHYVRAGAATAYPHPNQFFYNKVKRGEPLYVNTDLKLGGYGGEGYRNYLIGPWTDEQVKMWQIVADCVQIQVEESKPGVACSEVAYKIHKYQVDNGMQDYIYHRPAHGSGQNSEGHQPPFISLGDHTVIEEGMTFSVEPGLYDSEAGIGVNPSDNLLVTKKGGVLMSCVPYSREWSFLRL
ncbi:MAG: aminopeptidase P family protein [Planctomycetes bacterium]|nr:aminopeptidase P family protein [Planctomycetota bacterium]